MELSHQPEIDMDRNTTTYLAGTLRRPSPLTASQDKTSTG